MSRCLAVLAVVTGLSACGGGLDDLGPPPEVSLGVSTTLTYRGAAIQLRASAYASNGMEHVRFYRLDYGVPPVLLGYAWAPPANLMTSIPINAGPTVSYFARACDMEGLCSDSNVVTVSVYL